jgi:hypothetical protein
MIDFLLYWSVLIGYYIILVFLAWRHLLLRCFDPVVKSFDVSFNSRFIIIVIIIVHNIFIICSSFIVHFSSLLILRFPLLQLSFFVLCVCICVCVFVNCMAASCVVTISTVQYYIPLPLLFLLKIKNERANLVLYLCKGVTICPTSRLSHLHCSVNDHHA